MIKEIKVKIENDEFIIKTNFKTFIKLEKILNQKISEIDLEYIENQFQLMHCSLQANNKNYSQSFDEFIDFVDSHPEIMTDFKSTLTDEIVEEIEEKTAKKK